LFVAVHALTHVTARLQLTLPRGAADTIVASGPQDASIAHAAPLLRTGGRLYINATRGNKFKYGTADGTVDIATLRGLRLSMEQDFGPLHPRFAELRFALTDGTPIDSRSIGTSIFRKE
jgi:hypothetical protein